MNLCQDPAHTHSDVSDSSDSDSGIASTKPRRRCTKTAGTAVGDRPDMDSERVLFLTRNQVLHKLKACSGASGTPIKTCKTCMRKLMNTTV